MRSAVFATLLTLAVSSLIVGCAGPAASSASDASRSAPLEVVAKVQGAPGNIAVTPSGRIIVSMHQFYEPRFRVCELRDGELVPFPNAQWASAPDGSGAGLHSVLGIRADRRGIVWMLDNGGPVPRFVAWDTTADRLHTIIEIPPPATRPGSFPNDFAIDHERSTMYIADIGGDDGPALIVVDLASGRARRVLAGHHSTRSEDVPMVIDGREVTLGAGQEAKPARVGVNPITIDPAAQWVYFGPMHGTSMYRVRAQTLADPTVSPDALARAVQRFGEKPISDGISIDSKSNLYVTDVVAGAIGVIRPDGRYAILVQDQSLLSWPDAIAAGPDGWMYVAVNQLHRSAPLNAGVNASRPPYAIVRFRPLAHPVPGR